MTLHEINKELIKIGKLALNIRSAHNWGEYDSAAAFQAEMDKLIDELIDKINGG